MTCQLSVLWKPVSGKWEQCVYWSQWNIIPHSQKAVILEGQPLQVCCQYCQWSKVQQEYAWWPKVWFCVLKFSLHASECKSLTWIRMLMLYDRIWISVTSILTSQKMFVGCVILFYYYSFCIALLLLCLLSFLPRRSARLTPTSVRWQRTGRPMRRRCCRSQPPRRPTTWAACWSCRRMWR